MLRTGKEFLLFFIYLCGILELVRTVFAACGSEEVFPRKSEKVTKPRKWQFQVFLKDPDLLKF